jgi:hypothetical protein
LNLALPAQRAFALRVSLSAPVVFLFASLSPLFARHLRLLTVVKGKQHEID